MNHKVFPVASVIAALLWASSPLAFAQLNLDQADGSDGSLLLDIPDQTVEIDLATAMDGSWLNPSPSTDEELIGTYDASQWAVVFKYEEVVIARDSEVSFLNHPSGAPVVWLVSGNVTIDGTLDLNGEPGTDGPNRNSLGGPGGFPGGRETVSSLSDGPGFGPGGASLSDSGGGHRVAGGAFGISYGNSRILPLIGGSGGGSDNQNGGGGGGSILIFCGGDMIVNGSIQARGGDGDRSKDGSGGAIRIISGSLMGSGALTAQGVSSSAGRIRIETNSMSSSLTVLPETIFVSPETDIQIFPDATYPTARIVSIVRSGNARTDNISTDPEYLKPFTERFGDQTPDGEIDITGTALVFVVTTNIDPAAQSSSVVLQMRPLRGSPQQFTDAAPQSGSTTTLATWVFTVDSIPEGNVVFQAIARSM